MYGQNSERKITISRGVAWRGVAWRGVAWRGVALEPVSPICSLL